MNFFEQQRQAKRRTVLLVILMTLAVFSLIAITCLALTLPMEEVPYVLRQYLTLDLRLVTVVSAVVLGIVLLGSVAKYSELATGGKVVARRLGGRLINHSASTLEEQRLLNVVEEMALASGTVVPSVYLLPEPGINAFVAGFTPQDAVIGVTQGAISLLSRDELQGVIAHEFSHIYNGDMRLNTRLIAIVHGILVLGLTGGYILRKLEDVDKVAPRRLIMVPFVVGMVLCVVGFAGSFFGNLIKASVSRQREFLADATAVQFTRNPQSISGALKKIGGYEQGSNIKATRAAEFSHLYFGAGVSTAIGGMLATHPELSERIRRIDAHWDGSFPTIEAPALAAMDVATVLPLSDAFSDLPAAATAVLYDVRAVQESIAMIGSPQPEHITEARRLLEDIPQALKLAARSTDGAEALLYGLVLSPSTPVLAMQLETLQPQVDSTVFNTLDLLRESLSTLNPGLRLPLLDLAIPSLKQLGKKTFAAVKRNLNLLIEADHDIDLLEWTLLRIVERNVDGAPAVQFKFGLFQCADELTVLLGTLANAGQPDPKNALAALEYAWEGLPFERGHELPSELENLEAALKRLRHLMPEEKPALLNALVRCVEHDGKVTVAEAQLMRAIADLLDCPMPPVLFAQHEIAPTTTA
ncbi:MULTISPECIES: M48 family metallopeptidase [unclassified Pseudomonas]|jgi:Zn-dependent protease with chaperone function|uniref:M48 family metallopeptidase n=1 Tax=unclassified Pseudomonas TaxID=196821 RepID=UPI001C461005|nr:MULTISPECIES: M48 family metallopeptidase [unclassified Pseudomonas]MBV7513731.1 M48 family metalloprotease [Pseudomonas sp. PDM25]